MGGVQGATDDEAVESSSWDVANVLKLLEVCVCVCVCCGPLHNRVSPLRAG